jgi:hypothetical protein
MHPESNGAACATVALLERSADARLSLNIPPSFRVDGVQQGLEWAEDPCTGLIGLLSGILDVRDPRHSSVRP